MSATVAQTVANSARDLRQWFARSLWGDNLLLILLLISGDLRLFQALVNAEDNFKSSSPVENKRHTNAHQLYSTTTDTIPPLRHVLSTCSVKDLQTILSNIFL